jgi:putative membrane protein
MKNNKIDTCISLFATAVFAMTLLFTACKSEPKTEDTKEVAEEQNEAKFTDTKEDAAEFLVDAAEFNLAQMEFGKLTEVKSHNADVKAFGKMMAEMHVIKVKELAIYADSKQVSVPTSLTDENKKDYDNLNKVGIDDFDKKYLENVVERHKKAIEDYTEEMNKTNDEAFKKWINMELASLREHLDSAMSLQAKLDK